MKATEGVASQLNGLLFDILVLPYTGTETYMQCCKLGRRHRLRRPRKPKRYIKARALRESLTTRPASTPPATTLQGIKYSVLSYSGRPLDARTRCPFVSEILQSIPGLIISNRLICKSLKFVTIGDQRRFSSFIKVEDFQSRRTLHNPIIN